MRLDWKTSVFALAVIGLVSLAAAGPLMSAVEQPAYKVERSEGSIEIRFYPPSIVAEVVRLGDRKASIQEGFSIIASYIFGSNMASQKIAMTAPVMQEQGPEKQPTEQIAAQNWTVQFIMPAKWSLNTLPKPRDSRIVLKDLSARTLAVIRFSGLATEAALRKKTDELSNYVAERRLTPAGAPIFAFYNPPWTLPWFRRNEVMIPINENR